MTPFMELFPHVHDSLYRGLTIMASVLHRLNRGNTTDREILIQLLLLSLVANAKQW